MGVISPDTVRIVKSTAPVLKEHSVSIVERFYSILFERHPEAAAYFNIVPSSPAGGNSDCNSSGGSRGQSREQIQRLSMAVLFYAQKIDALDTLGPVLDRIASKHVSRATPAAFYPIIGSCLIAAIGDVLGAAATPEIVAAWTEAYGFLADALKATEAKVAAGLAEKTGGWTTYAPFVVAAVAKEAVPAGQAASLTLRPTAEAPVVSPTWKAGQYVGLCLPLTAVGGGQTETGASVRRTCFITSAPAAGADIRVTLVTGPGVPVDPVVESLMRLPVGAAVEVSPPLGSFTYDHPVLGSRRPSSPAVFVTSEAGVPEVATLVREALAAGRPVTLVRHVTSDVVAAAPAAEQLLGAELVAAAAAADGGHLSQVVVRAPADVAAAVGARAVADAEFFVASTPPTLAGEVRDALVGGSGVPLDRVLHAGYVPA
ncbi:hypothetical protein MMPV_006116 [Pyropia vietnamensis]